MFRENYYRLPAFLSKFWTRIVQNSEPTHAKLTAASPSCKQSKAGTIPMPVW